MPKTIEELGLANKNVAILDHVYDKKVCGYMFSVFTIDGSINPIFRQYPLLTIDDQEINGIVYPHAFLIAEDYYKTIIDNDILSEIVEDFGTAHLVRMGHIKAS